MSEQIKYFIGGKLYRATPRRLIWAAVIKGGYNALGLPDPNYIKAEIYYQGNKSQKPDKTKKYLYIEKNGMGNVILTDSILKKTVDAKMNERADGIQEGNYLYYFGEPEALSEYEDGEEEAIYKSDSQPAAAPCLLADTEETYILQRCKNCGAVLSVKIGCFDDTKGEMPIEIVKCGCLGNSDIAETIKKVIEEIADTAAYACDL